MSFREQVTGSPATLIMTRRTLHTAVGLGWSPRTVVEKRHQDKARADREQFALTTLALQLGRSPTVLARRENTLWLTMLAGRTVSPTELPAEAWCQAGQWLRQLHDLRCPDTDAMPLATALSRRWQGVLRRARSVVSDGLVDRCRERVGDPAALATRRVWCHRDFTPDNWMWNGERLSILDFEHCRADEPWSDLVKLEASVLGEAPQARAAFYEGYGPLLHTDQREARVCWHGLATLTWGLRNREQSFIDLGRRILGDLDHTNTALDRDQEPGAR